MLSPGQPVATDGHTNLQSWCLMSGFRKGIVDSCIIQRELSKAGRLSFEEQGQSGVLEADGSYCFSAGHCLETRVTNATTIADAERLCDEKYGRAVWSTLTIQDVLATELSAAVRGQLSLQTGIQNHEAAVRFAQVACAMGNFHCDVIYCRENYCNKEHFRSRYQHLEPKR